MAPDAICLGNESGRRTSCSFSVTVRVPMQITTIEPFLHYFDRLRERTVHVFDRVPPTDVEWRPAPDRFSFGDQLRHLAALKRHMDVENALGPPSRYPGQHEDLASGYDNNIVSYAERLHQASICSRAFRTRPVRRPPRRPPGPRPPSGRGFARWPSTRCTTEGRSMPCSVNLARVGRHSSR